MLSPPIRRSTPFLPSASAVRRLPSVVEADGERTKLRNVPNDKFLDSCVERPLTKEEKYLNIENCCDICDTTAYTHTGAINIIENNRKMLTSNHPTVNQKLWKIIDNLGENELFEDPDFPAAPKSLFYR